LEDLTFTTVLVFDGVTFVYDTFPQEELPVVSNIEDVRVPAVVE
jgi:hypothetical protein